jgi:hypothetical protein
MTENKYSAQYAEVVGALRMYTLPNCIAPHLRQLQT